MICDPCKAGGKMNQDPRIEWWVRDLPGQSYMRWVTPAQAHAACEAPTTCPCHHLTGQFIRTGSNG